MLVIIMVVEALRHIKWMDKVVLLKVSHSLEVGAVQIDFKKEWTILYHDSF